MKIGNKFLLAALLIIGACSFAPSGGAAEFNSLVKGKLYEANFRAYGSASGKSAHLISFKDGYVLNASPTPPSGFTWTWTRLYKIIQYYDGNRVAVQLADPSWDFPWPTPPAEEILGKDQIHIIRVLGNSISRTPYGQLTTSGNYFPGLHHDSALENIGISARPAAYPKVLTIYANSSDLIGTESAFDPLNP